MKHADRLARFTQLSATLALLSTQELNRMADVAQALASGIGGSTMTLNIDGTKVFAKRVRLTDLERRPEHLMSTANLFGLPPHYQRNVGSAGFGVWRELAAHALTNSWVLSQQLDCFPLMFHWRVLDGAAGPKAAPPPAEWTDVEGMSAYWSDAGAIKQRLAALAGATASVLIVMEYLPWTLSDWLNEQLSTGPSALQSACAMVEACLMTDIPKINALGLLHGDAHHGNMLTDGRRLYYADLGLASSARFALTPDEQVYLQQHNSLDIAYVRSRWAKWLLKASCPSLTEAAAQMALIKRIAQGEVARLLLPDLALPSLARMIERHAPIACLINDFYAELHERSRSSPYPQEAIEALLVAR